MSCAHYLPNTYSVYSIPKTQITQLLGISVDSETEMTEMSLRLGVTKGLCPDFQRAFLGARRPSRSTETRRRGGVFQTRACLSSDFCNVG